MEVRNQAKELFEKGERLKDIADTLKLNYNTVKQWKSRDKWKKPKCNQNKKVTKKVTAKSDNKIVNESKNNKVLEEPELTEKQRLFCQYYINNFNATIAYLRAYDCSYKVANVEGYRNLVKPSIKAEIQRLKELKKQSFVIDEDDIVERYMRIAFADMTDFVEFGQEEIPVITKDGLITVPNPETGEKEPLMQKINVLKFKDSNYIDGGLICEIKTSRQGASIKLEDRQKALDWLSDFFEMNPEHKHRKAHDENKLQLERERLEHTKEMDKIKAW